MRFAFVFLLCRVAFAQAMPPPPPVPAPSPESAKVPDDTVVATVNGEKITAGEIRRYMSLVGSAQQRIFTMNPESAVQQLWIQKYLADQAEKHHFDQRYPTKEQLEIARQQILALVEINDLQNNVPVSLEEQEKYYSDHPQEFQESKVRVIKVAFGKERSEAEAKTKAEALRKKALEKGADFGKLAHDNSDDAATAEKNGDWGVIKGTSPFPDEVKKAIFSLKVGGISEPVKTSNGYYIFRVDEITKQPYEQVREQIYTNLKSQRFQVAWQAIQDKNKVKVENEDFFKHTPGAAAATPGH